MKRGLPQPYHRPPFSELFADNFQQPRHQNPLAGRRLQFGVLQKVAGGYRFVKIRKLLSGRRSNLLGPFPLSVRVETEGYQCQKLAIWILFSRAY